MEDTQTAELTREAWLQAAVDEMRPWLADAGSPVPEVSISIGWPGGRGKKTGVIGQCWAAGAAADGRPAIFVSPVHQDPVATLNTVLHEMIHAAGHMGGHRGGFRKAAIALGFTKPFTSTPATPELVERLKVVAEKLGEFPHGRVNGGGLGGGPTVQSTRMIKCSCDTCGYTVRTTRKWLEQAIPTCPLCGNDEEMTVG